MAKVAYDDRSFIVDDKRIWLVSGEIHYFRVPAALWRDRLLKAKRAGLNCVSTYVAWNLHEMKEGEWDFHGDKDIAAFIRMAGELGLYVILRPGPYICGEWDFGGLPAWLTTKTGISYRTSNAAYTHYYDKYFRQLLARLAEQQVTRGGNIILIQNENEYGVTTMPDRLSYLEFISQLFRRSGFDIPIITCNDLTQPILQDSIECVNAGENAVGQLKRLRTSQNTTPLMMTEFWSGWFDKWGDEHQYHTPKAVARRALEAMGCGGQINYYMFHGGTNFGFWGSHLADADDAYQTTSYDFDAPIAEGGGLTEKYYLTRLVNMLASSMGRFIAPCDMGTPGVGIKGSSDVLNISGPAGGWAVVTNNGADEIDSVTITLPTGKELDVSLETLGATAVPVGISLSAVSKLNYSNLMPLGLFNGHVLVLHGPAGWQGQICINGREVCHEVPEGDEPLLVEHEGVLLAIINSELAMRTWLVNGNSLVFGPQFVGEDLEHAVHAKGAKQFAILGNDGKLAHKKIKSSASRKPTPPRLGTFKRLCVCREPVDKKLQWHKLDRPRDVDRLGIHHGYVWYRLEINSDRAKKRYLFLPECEDRASVYVNGSFAGVWGRGDGAARSPLGVNLKRGVNVITMLVDNLGRRNAGYRLGEMKGLFGHVWDAKLLRTLKFKLKEADGFSKRIVPRQFAHIIARLESQPVWTATLDVSLKKVTPIHLSFNSLPHSVVVLCNDRVAGFFPHVNGGNNYGDVTLGAELKKGKNTIKLMLWGDVSAKSLENIKLHLLEECLSDKAKWGYRPWVIPRGEGHVVGKDQPAWYLSKFKYNAPSEPLFIRVLGAKKGQLFLNGHNIGRFWNIGPQEYYYLPECWLKEQNELLIFEEHGSTPSRSQLVFFPAGPYSQ